MTLKQRLERNISRSFLIGVAGIAVMIATERLMTPPYSRWSWELLPGAAIIVSGFVHYILTVRCPYCQALAAVQEYRRLYIPDSCPTCGKPFDTSTSDT